MFVIPTCFKSVQLTLEKFDTTNNNDYSYYGRLGVFSFLFFFLYMFSYVRSINQGQITFDERGPGLV